MGDQIDRRMWIWIGEEKGDQTETLFDKIARTISPWSPRYGAEHQKIGT